MISEVHIVPLKPKEGLVGFASLVLDQKVYIGSIGIFTRPNGGFRLTYPTRKTDFGSVPITYPINRKIADEIEQAIIKKYEEVVRVYGRHNQANFR